MAPILTDRQTDKQTDRQTGLIETCTETLVRFDLASKVTLRSALRSYACTFRSTYDSVQKCRSAASLGHIVVVVRGGLMRSLICEFCGTSSTTAHWILQLIVHSLC